MFTVVLFETVFVFDDAPELQSANVFCVTDGQIFYIVHIIVGPEF